MWIYRNFQDILLQSFLIVLLILVSKIQTTKVPNRPQPIDLTVDASAPPENALQSASDTSPAKGSLNLNVDSGDGSVPGGNVVSVGPLPQKPVLITPFLDNNIHIWDKFKIECECRAMLGQHTALTLGWTSHYAYGNQSVTVDLNERITALDTKAEIKLLNIISERQIKVIRAQNPNEGNFISFFFKLTTDLDLHDAVMYCISGTLTEVAADVNRLKTTQRFRIELPRRTPTLRLFAEDGYIIYDQEYVNVTCDLTLGTRGTYYLSFIFSSIYYRCQKTFLPNQTSDEQFTMEEEELMYVKYRRPYPDRRVLVRFRFIATQNLGGMTITCTTTGDKDGVDSKPPLKDRSMPLLLQYRQGKPSIRSVQIGSRMHVSCQSLVGSAQIMSFGVILEQGKENTTIPVIHLYSNSTPAAFAKAKIPYTVRKFTTKYDDDAGPIFDLLIYINKSDLPGRIADVVCSSTYTRPEEFKEEPNAERSKSMTKQKIYFHFVLNNEESIIVRIGLFIYVVIVLLLGVASMRYFSLEPPEDDDEPRQERLSFRNRKSEDRK